MTVKLSLTPDSGYVPAAAYEPTPYGAAQAFEDITEAKASAASAQSASNAMVVVDSRSVVDEPQNKTQKRLTADFKFNTSVGNPPVTAGGPGGYSHILTMAGWSTNEGSGGWPTQLSIGTQGMAYRQATNATTWGSWTQFVTNNGGSWNITAANADTIDSLHATSFVRSDAATLIDRIANPTAGTAIRSSNIGGLVQSPGGGHYTTTASPATGAIKITLPTLNSADMLSFWVDVYDYTTGESMSVFISGYTFTTGWLNTTAIILANQAQKNFTVRFGKNATNNIVWIGETTSTWAYPQIKVRDFQGGYATTPSDYTSGWSIGFATSFDTVDVISYNNLPVSKVEYQVVPVAALNVDCTLGNYFTKTVSTNSTFTFSGAPASGTAYQFTLEVTNTAGTITFPASVSWPGGTGPTLVTNRLHIFSFSTIDGGTKWRGAYLHNYTI